MVSRNPSAQAAAAAVGPSAAAAADRGGFHLVGVGRIVVA